MENSIYILSEGSGLCYVGKDSGKWSDEARDAMQFDTPAEAWRFAKRLQKEEAEFLEGAPIEIERYDPNENEAERVVSTHTDYAVLRSSWHRTFGEPLPLDIPARPESAQIARARLANYLNTVDWQKVRERGGESFGFDRTFWEEADKLFQADRPDFEALWSSVVPPDIPPPDLSAPRWRSALDGAGREEEQNAVVEAEPIAATRRVADGKRKPPEAPPAYVTRHFVESRNSFFYKQRPDVLAFSVRGQSFRAHDNSVMTATAIMEMAQQRGWTSVRVRGATDFRRAVWAAAMERGLQVAGYKPTRGETALLAQGSSPDGHPSRQSRETTGTETRRTGDPPLTGVIIDMGAAPYQHDSNNSRSFYVTLRDRAGNETTHWGVGLQQAIEHSGVNVGQRVRLARFGTIPVEVDRTVRDDKGDVSYRTPQLVQRRVWEVHLLDKTRKIPEGGKDTKEPVAPSRDPQLEKALKIIEARLPGLTPQQRAEFRQHFDQAYARLSRAPGAGVPARDRASPALSKSARGR